MHFAKAFGPVIVRSDRSFSFRPVIFVPTGHFSVRRASFTLNEMDRGVSISSNLMT